MATSFTQPAAESHIAFVPVDVLTNSPADTSNTFDRVSVSQIDFLGQVIFPTGLQFDSTEVGGLSGITYDPQRQLYYSISDDRSERQPARFYTLSIDLSDGQLDPIDVQFQSVVSLQDPAGQPFVSGSIDPEAISLSRSGTLYIGSEGNANQQIAPFVNGFSLTGRQTETLPIPSKYLPTDDRSSGIRNNLAFESLTLSPDQRYLYTATESALYQDGEPASLEAESPARILRFDLTTGQADKEYLYPVDPIPVAPNPPDGFADNGLVELIALDNNGNFLALERSFAAGVGNHLRLYQVQLQNTTDLRDVDALSGLEVDAIAQKRLLLDFNELGITLDNFEGMTLGPILADGRQSLTIVSDNNFNPDQSTQFLSFALELQTTPAVAPVAETPSTIDSDEFEPDLSQTLLGDVDDPAIWVNPTNLEGSLIIGALKDGGLATFNLDGTVYQTLTVQPYGELRYNNVDLVYGFALGDRTVDLAIATDRRNDTLAIWAIDPATRQLIEVTAAELGDPAASIFGIDDGEQTAYGIATYTSPISGKTYLFVSQREGNLIAQLELIAQDNGTVSARTVRTLSAPIPPDAELEDAQFEGMVVDRELGYLYAGQEQRGIWKFSAEPDAPSSSQLIHAVQPEGEILAADVEGLTIYYGAGGQGYLLASSQGDSSYAVFDRAGNHDYLGSFVIDDGEDGVEESDGADVINVSLGDRFPNGLLVVQDGSNDPPQVDRDDEEVQDLNTNFKLIPWESVANAFETPLLIDPRSYNPRSPQPHSLLAVASGDVTQTSAMLWARSSQPGSLRFEYSIFPQFDYIFGFDAVTVTDPLQPVKVGFSGLSPGRTYYYRAIDAAGAIKTGQFQTPHSIGTTAGLRFGVTGDWQQAPPYPSLANADQRDLSFFLKLGDTIYADTETPALAGITQARSLSDFRTKQAEITSDRFGLNTVQDLYAATAILATIDDHELVDNFAGGAAPGDSPDAPDIGSDDRPLFTDDVAFVNDTQAYEDALLAFQNYHPLQDRFYGETGDDRTAHERQLYRYNTYGSDAAMFVLDTRSFRDDQLEPADLSQPVPFLAQTFDPSRTLLGQQQLRDLQRDLLQAETAGITWKFVAVPEPIQNFGVVNAEDRFEGYAAERTELLKFIDDHDIDNVVFLAADFHGTIVNNLTYQLGPGQPQIATNAFEIVTGPAAFFEGLFGRAVVNISQQAGLITPEQRAFYEALPTAPDADDLLNDRDDFVKQLLVAQTDGLGYDPVGLNQNLPIADGLIDAQLLQGDYVTVHNYGWTEFEIDAATQQLTVTTYGIPDYSEAELLSDPAAIARLTPAVISQFEVTPVL